MSWQRVLDRVHTPAQLDELADNAAALGDALELPADHDAADALVREVFEAIDAVTVRAMKVRQEYALADDGSLAAPTRNVFAQTIVSYAGRLDVLEDRARDVAARARAAHPTHTAELVVGAARSALALRDALFAGVLARVQARAASLVADADRNARDPRLSEAERTKWSAIRRDMEALAESPQLASTPLATRLASLPAQLDEAEVPREATLAELIEID